MFERRPPRVRVLLAARRCDRGVRRRGRRDDLATEQDLDEAFVTLRPEGEWPAVNDATHTNMAHVALAVDEAHHHAIVTVAIDNLVKGAVLTVYNDRIDPSHTTPIVDAFDEGLIVHTGEDLSSDELASLVERVPALREPVDALLEGAVDDEHVQEDTT